MRPRSSDHLEHGRVSGVGPVGLPVTPVDNRRGEPSPGFAGLPPCDGVNLDASSPHRQHFDLSVDADLLGFGFTRGVVAERDQRTRGCGRWCHLRDILGSTHRTATRFYPFCSVAAKRSTDAGARSRQVVSRDRAFRASRGCPSAPVRPRSPADCRWPTRYVRAPGRSTSPRRPHVPTSLGSGCPACAPRPVVSRPSACGQIIKRQSKPPQRRPYGTNAAPGKRPAPGSESATTASASPPHRPGFAPGGQGAGVRGPLPGFAGRPRTTVWLTTVCKHFRRGVASDGTESASGGWFAGGFRVSAGRFGSAPGRCASGGKESAPGGSAAARGWVSRGGRAGPSAGPDRPRPFRLGGGSPRDARSAPGFIGCFAHNRGVMLPGCAAKLPGYARNSPVARSAVALAVRVRSAGNKPPSYGPRAGVHRRPFGHRQPR